MTTASSADARRDELVERLFNSALGAMDLLCAYLGDRLGLYGALADAGPSTSAELAGVAGVNERYAREWLEQQAMAGILDAVDRRDGRRERRRYRQRHAPGHRARLRGTGRLRGLRNAPIENDFWRFCLLTPYALRDRRA